MNRQGRCVSNTCHRGQGIAFCSSIDVPGCRGISHTPLQTSPTRGRTPVPGSANDHPKTTTWALLCPIVGRIQYAPTLTVEKTGSFFEPVCFQGSYFSSEWVGAYRIRPPQRPRQGNEHPYPVPPTITPKQPPGPYRARSWGVCFCALP